MGNAIAKADLAYAPAARRETTAPVAVEDTRLPKSTPFEARFLDIYERLRDAMVALAARHLGEDVAQDIYQDVMLSFLDRMRKGDITIDQLNERLVAQSVRYQIVHHVRKDEQRISLDPELERSGALPQVGPFPDGATVELADVVMDLVVQLPVQQRCAMLLCLADGFSRADAAQMMGVTLETLKTHLKRGQATVRLALINAGVAAGVASTASSQVTRAPSVAALPASTEEPR